MRDERRERRMREGERSRERGGRRRERRKTNMRESSGEMKKITGKKGRSGGSERWARAICLRRHDRCQTGTAARGGGNVFMVVKCIINHKYHAATPPLYLLVITGKFNRPVFGVRSSAARRLHAKCILKVKYFPTMHYENPYTYQGQTKYP